MQQWQASSGIYIGQGMVKMFSDTSYTGYLSHPPSGDAKGWEGRDITHKKSLDQKYIQ